MQTKAGSLASQTARTGLDSLDRRQAEAASGYYHRRQTVTAAPDTLPRPETALQVPLADLRQLPRGAAYTTTGAGPGAPDVELTLVSDTVAVRARASPATVTTVEESSETLETLRALRALRASEASEASETAETSEQASTKKKSSGHLIGAIVALAAVLAFTIWRRMKE